MGKKKCRNLEGIKLTLKGALEEYKPDILEDSEEIYKLKTIVNNLPEVDKIIFLAYVELRSFTELSRALGVSRSTCFWLIRNIRSKIQEQYRKSNT